MLLDSILVSALDKVVNIMIQSKDYYIVVIIAFEVSKSQVSSKFGRDLRKL